MKEDKKTIIKTEICEQCVCNTWTNNTERCEGCIRETENYKTKKKYLSKPSHFMKKDKTIKQIMSQIKRRSARRNHCGRGERGWKVKGDPKYIHKILRVAHSRAELYSNFMNLPKRDILEAIEANNGEYALQKYYGYNNHDYPAKLTKDIEVFETTEDFKKKYPGNQYKCFSCKGISTNPTNCNSGVLKKRIYDDKPQKCGMYAFIGYKYHDKIVRYIIKEEFLQKPGVHHMFMPIDIEHEH